MELGTCNQFDITQEIVTNDEYQQDLSDLIYEYLMLNGFSLNSKGTKYYKSVLENIVLVLYNNPCQREINDLKEELFNPLSLFNINTAIESGAFYKEPVDGKIDFDTTKIVFGNKSTKVYIDNYVKPLILFRKEILNAIEESKVFFSFSKKVSDIIKENSNVFFAILSYNIGEFILGMVKEKNIQIGKITTYKLTYLMYDVNADGNGIIK